MTLSVVLITQNEEANLARTLRSVLPLVGDGRGEIIVVDSGSTDATLAIARSFGAKIFSEPWKGFAAQKNSAMDKATGDWVLQLDADEALEPDLVKEILEDALTSHPDVAGFWIPRKNFFLGRWIRHGGFYPDRKLRLLRRGAGLFQEYGAHPTIQARGPTGKLHHALLHHAYPRLSGYLDHMNRYSSSGAELAGAQGYRGFRLRNIVVRPLLTFLYNYGFRLGFLDGREGLLLHLYHATYVSWKYAKAWELGRSGTDRETLPSRGGEQSHSGR
ncbi:MAG TPA: glycosyltransferase family 2 protein [Terriglobales bacterium]|nr:glycosyltransferase family 2 protein [Terriglobales bacterium]